MLKAKRSIKESIFTSHMLIIIISAILTIIVFDLCLKFYINRQTNIQLKNASDMIEKSMKTELTELVNAEKTGNYKKTSNTLLSIDKIIKKAQTYLDINYAILGEKQNVLYPSKENSEEYPLLEKKLIPMIEKKYWLLASSNESNVFNFNINGKRYVAIIYDLKSKNNPDMGYLLFYSDLDKSSKLTNFVNIMLLSILFVTAIIALIISNNVSKKISLPISELSKYAKLIGERQYDVEFKQYDDVEIVELADTMQAMAQKLSSYDNAMKTFMQNASHELRTPMMSIQGYAEGIKYGVIDEKEKAVDIIIDESKRLSVLVEDLLYLSKIDALQEKLCFENINAEYVIRSSIERVNGIALNGEKIINFEYKEAPIIFKGDEEKLMRAIINVIGNCVRYAEKNIYVTLKKEEKGIVVGIEDDGHGFEEKEISQIFDRFYKGKLGNYGLGLAIAKSIIEKHNGTIEAKNSVKGGAYFEICLPQNYI